MPHLTAEEALNTPGLYRFCLSGRPYMTNHYAGIPAMLLVLKTPDGNMAFDLNEDGPGAHVLIGDHVSFIRDYNNRWSFEPCTEPISLTLFPPAPATPEPPDVHDS